LEEKQKALVKKKITADAIQVRGGFVL